MTRFLLPLLVVSACAAGDPLDSGSDPEGGPTGPYADLDNWICHPDLGEDVCTGDFSVTDVAEDGTRTVEPHAVASAPPVDCFYVYPTTSADPSPNSDRSPRDEETLTTQLQAGRYSEVCRVYAPAYRQVTLLGLIGDGDYALAYGDVLEAFRSFRAEAGDRPFLLLGHSQGTIHLTQLIAEEIEPDPELSEQLVAAHLLGGFVEVAAGQDIGGSFSSTPLCTSADQTGCVVHYVTFDAMDPPGPTALFGRSVVPGNVTACVNPGALLAGSATADVPLSGAYPTTLPTGSLFTTSSPFEDPTANPPIETPYFGLPAFLNGACVQEGGASYLSVAFQPDPSGPRTDGLEIDFLPGWGMHLLDFNVAQRDLVELAARQIQ